VLRVANRLGIATSDNPEVVEKQLQKALPKERWTVSSDTLILHGRRICRPKPMCDRCAARDLCRYYKTLGTSRARGRAKGGAVAKKRAAPAQRRRAK
jgi:endonuclease-3